MNKGSQLYRHFDRDGILLYVGISITAVLRLAGHRSESSWYKDIVKVEIENFDSEEEARKAEIQAIKTEKPIHNIAHNDSSELSAIGFHNWDEIRHEIVSGMWRYNGLNLTCCTLFQAAHEYGFSIQELNKEIRRKNISPYYRKDLKGNKQLVISHLDLYMLWDKRESLKYGSSYTHYRPCSDMPNRASLNVYNAGSYNFINYISPMNDEMPHSPRYHSPEHKEFMAKLELAESL